MEQKNFSSLVREIITTGVSLRNTTPENYGVLDEAEHIVRVVSTRTCKEDLKLIANALRKANFCVLYPGTNYLTVAMKRHHNRKEISKNPLLTFEEAMEFVKKFSSAFKVVPHDNKAGATLISCRNSKYQEYLFDVLIRTLSDGGMNVATYEGSNFIEFSEQTATGVQRVEQTTVTVAVPA